MAPGFQPTVTTTTITAITTTTAIGGGNVVSSGATAVTARGVVYGLLPNPTTGDSKTTTTGSTGVFTTPITGLLPDTTYFVRAYAANSNGIGYDTSGELSFETEEGPDTVAVTLTNNSFTLWAGVGYIPGLTPTDEEVEEQLEYLTAKSILFEGI
jgi:hypothetical protein